MKTRTLTIFFPALLVAVLCLPVRAADNYPSRPITVISPLAAGSAADGFGRLVVTELAKQLGQPVVVDNRQGAGGNIGMTFVARAAPDGYTIAQAGHAQMIINHALYANTGYDSLKDFAPIAVGAVMANAMVVRADSPYKTVQDVVDAVRSKPPGTFTYSSSGIGSSHHISGVMFGKLTGTTLLHVPYGGAPQGITAILSGDVNMGFYNIPAALGQIRAGKLRILAVTSSARAPLFPDTPTLDESGLKGYSVRSWIGYLAPAGTPPDVVAKLHDGLDRVLSTPSVRKTLIDQGYNVEPVPLAPPASFAKLMRDEMAVWPAIVKAAGAKLE